MPYRKHDTTAPTDDPCVPDRDEIASYVLLVGAGALPVGGALAGHAAFHTEATIGLFMLGAGALGLLGSCRSVWRARRDRR